MFVRLFPCHFCRNLTLQQAEMLDQFAEKNHQSASPPYRPIGFKAATFVWSSADAGGTITPSRQGFRLRVEDELLFKENVINLIIGELIIIDASHLITPTLPSGPTGSGKTSLLHALLGEMHFIPSNPDSWFNLPRNEGIAYAPQESWVLNASIRVCIDVYA